jgi:hypothetical protein
MEILFRVEGKMSTFGGPKDSGMKPNEGLALFSSEQDMKNHGLGDFLLPKKGSTGLGRRLNPDKPYLACRWWESGLNKEFVRNTWAWVENAKTGQRARARPVDSGPAEWTNRVADLSPSLAAALKLKTNDICRVTISDEASEFKLDIEHSPVALAAAMPTAFAGPRVFTTEEWNAKPARVTDFAKHPGIGIVIHNTEGANRAPLPDPTAEREAAFANARQIQKDHFARGFSDTGQHFTISQGGVITEGRHGTLQAARAGLVVRGAHSPKANDEWWGIEIAGDNRAQFVVTNEQWTTLVDLCVWLCRLTGGKALQIQPHDHFKSTTCPGHIKDHLDILRSDVKAKLP